MLCVHSFRNFVSEFSSTHRPLCASLKPRPRCIESINVFLRVIRLCCNRSRSTVGCLLMLTPAAAASCSSGRCGLLSLAPTRNTGCNLYTSSFPVDDEKRNVPSAKLLNTANMAVFRLKDAFGKSPRRFFACCAPVYNINPAQAPNPDMEENRIE